MDEEPQPKKKTPSDQLRTATLQEYVAAHSKPTNGNGKKGFFHSNLFVALVIFLLSQALVGGGAFVSFWFRTVQMSEWKGNIDSTLKRMDEQGTTYGHFNDQREDNKLIEIETRLKKVEDDTRHIEVLESEHRRLTRDVEDLRNAKK